MTQLSVESVGGHNTDISAFQSATASPELRSPGAVTNAPEKSDGVADESKTSDSEDSFDFDTENIFGGTKPNNGVQISKVLSNSVPVDDVTPILDSGSNRPIPTYSEMINSSSDDEISFLDVKPVNQPESRNATSGDGPGLLDSSSSSSSIQRPTVIENTSVFEKPIKRPASNENSNAAKKAKPTESIMIDLTLDDDADQNATTSRARPLEESDDEIIFTGEKILTPEPFPESALNGLLPAPPGMPSGMPLAIPPGRPVNPPFGINITPGVQPPSWINYNQPVPLPNGVTHGNQAVPGYHIDPLPAYQSSAPDSNNLSRIMNYIQSKYAKFAESIRQNTSKIKKLGADYESNLAQVKHLSENMTRSAKPQDDVGRIETLTKKIQAISRRLDYLKALNSSLVEQNDKLQMAENTIRARPQLAVTVFARIVGEAMAPSRQNMAPPQEQPFAVPQQPFLPSLGPHDDMDTENIAKLIDNIQPDDEGKDDAELVPTPPEMSIKLLKHQRLGLEWLLKMEKSASKGGILADDMGLGKTVQSIALMLAHKSEDLRRKTTLIVGPVALLRQWQAEIANKVRPDSRLRTFLYHSSDKVASFRGLGRYDVVLTSYGTLGSEYKKHYAEALKDAGPGLLPEYGAGGRKYRSPFYSKETKFFRIILDEAHMTKNSKTLAARACAQLRAEHRLCLSGTPMQNSAADLYSLIRFLRIRPYRDERRFRTAIVLPLRNRSDEGRHAMRRLQALLKAILLRRTKTSRIDGAPILQLTPRIVKKETIVMDGEEDQFYQALASKVEKEARKLLQSETLGNYSSALTLLLRLRQACCHSFLVRIGDRIAQLNNGEVPLDDAASSQATKTELSRDNLEKVKRMAMLCGKWNAPTVQFVSDEINKGTATCPLCYDGLIGDNTSILYPCGHALCSECISAFLENFAAEEDNCANCPLCSKLVLQSDIVSYAVFDQVCIQGRSNEDVVKQFEDESTSFTAKEDEKTSETLDQMFPKNRKISLKQKIILELLQAQGNQFYPSPKMSQCLKLIKEINASTPEDKIIIFSQFTSFFDLFGKVLMDNKIKFLRYDGTMSMDDRNAVISEFFATLEKKVMLISLKAGNVGLTLTCASHVIIIDPFWNPYVEEQAMDRAHRIGQLKTVHVHRLLTTNTVEDRIMSLQEKKRELVENALNENGFKKIGVLGRQELRYLFGISNTPAG